MVKNRTKESLEELLSESVASAKKREKSTFDQLAGNSDPLLILFGAGGLGKRTLAGLRKLNIEPLCFSDNNQSLWNSTVDGMAVYSPEEALRKFPDAVFVLCIWSDVIGHPLKEVENQLNSFKKTTVVSFGFLYWKYPEAFLPYFGIELPHRTLEQADSILSAFSLWSDDASCNEYLAQVRWRLGFDYGGLSVPVKYKQYFPEDIFGKDSNEIFIDCGAYDGDTLRTFLNKYGIDFNKYFACEPDPQNFKKLNDFVSGLPDLRLRDKIEVRQYAISDRRKTIPFAANGSLQSGIREDGNITVDCVALDEEFKNYIPTYIKMDTEGSEPEIIQGASNTIKNFSPILAISIYHRHDHIWQLPSLVHGLSFGYKFFLRPHCKASWDLVCYAVPQDRLRFHKDHD
jgi:FkbM family methyltransferase